MQTMKCPACNQEISLLAALRAITPYFLRCGRCRTVARINMRGLHALVLAGALTLASGLLASYYSLRDHSGVTGAVVVSGALAAFVLFECVALAILSRKAHLSISRLGPDVPVLPVTPPTQTPSRPRQSPPDSSSESSH